ALVEHAVIVGGFSAGFRFDVHTLQIRRDDNAGAGVTDEIPSNEVLVTAIERIRECALDRVRANEIEELCGTIGETTRAIGLDLAENGILIVSRKSCEGGTF